MEKLLSRMNPEEIKDISQAFGRELLRQYADQYEIDFCRLVTKGKPDLEGDKL